MNSKRLSLLCCYWLVVSLSLGAMTDQDEKESRDAAVATAVLDLASVTSIDLRGEETDERFRKVVLLGFNAVPVLIAHLNDPQPTKVRPYPDEQYVLRIRNVVMQLLQDLAGRELSGAAFVGKDMERTLRRSAVERWFIKARAMGEERYMVEHVLESKQSLNQTMLFIITHKYPARLAEVYRTLLNERPELRSDAVARAIMASSLTLRSKRELIGCGLSSRELEHRTPALLALRSLDAVEYDTRLIGELRKLPAKPQIPFWRSPEARIAYLVCCTTNPVVWQALDKAARRSHVGLRMEFLARMYCDAATPATRQHQLRFLAGFLDDKMIRDVSVAPKLFSGPYAGRSIGHHEFPRMEVRNYAALCLARTLPLAIDGAPRPNWDGAQWKGFRDAVGRALRREGITPPSAEKHKGNATP